LFFGELFFGVESFELRIENKRLKFEVWSLKLKPVIGDQKNPFTNY